MTEQQYFKEIKALHTQLEKNELDEVKRKLTELYQFKPVRLPWMVAEAEWKLKSGLPWKEINSRLYPDIVYRGMNYTGISEYMDYLDSTQKNLAEEDLQRHHFLTVAAGGKDISAYQETLKTAIAMCENALDRESLQMLGQCLYAMDEMTAYLIVAIEQERQGWKPLNRNRAFFKWQNYGYLEMKIKSQSSSSFILIQDRMNERLTFILAKLLSGMNHKVYLLENPSSMQVTSTTDRFQVLESCIKDSIIQNGMANIRTAKLYEDEEEINSNCEDIIDFICQELQPDENAILLATGTRLDTLAEGRVLRKKMGRLSAVPHNAEVLQQELQFGWVGSYLRFISDIYGYDVEKGMKEPANKAFSIVIPVRNSADTLRYTLQTCLNQNYRGDYEIIISDNSVNGMYDVQALCEEIQDKRIRYIKTPRDLPLSKSFEYAFLQARGEFIFSIGADDGLLPWALEALEKVRADYPEEPIIQWYRGFYAWPGFNGGQENMFVFPKEVKGGEYNPYYMDRTSYRKLLTESVQNIYVLPNLYLNSGFCRKYMWRLLQKTGRLWDGWNQDVYMGIMNTCINDRILNLDYPLTIAGMSTGSMGYLNTAKRGRNGTNIVNQKARVMLNWGNMGGHVFSRLERQLPDISNDTIVLANSVLRAVTYGVMSRENADEILDYKQIFSSVYENLSITSEKFDRFLQEGRCLAQQRGTLFLDWFMREIYQKYTIPTVVDEELIEQQRKQKKYKKGKTAAGGIILDASEYGVQDIAGAVLLFSKFAEYGCYNE